MRHSISPTDDPYLGTIDKIFFDWSKIQKNKSFRKQKGIFIKLKNYP